MRCPQRKIWEEKTVLFRSVELTCVALGTYQISAPYIKRQVSQRETQQAQEVEAAKETAAAAAAEMAAKAT